MPELTWTGKSAVKNHHHAVPYRLLQDDPARSVNLSPSPSPGQSYLLGEGEAQKPLSQRGTSVRERGWGEVSDNLLVHGDNLLALKALLPYYAGKVKVIYIDPPYNTGNEGWVYNDRVNSPEMKEWLDKVVGREAEDLNRHDKWLCMMYPRLQLLKQFLREDGVIFISLDDNEAPYLRLMMDEIFSERNFIATVIWHKRISPANDAKYFSQDHDYIFVYSKDSWKPYRIEKNDEQLKYYKNPDDDPRGVWNSSAYTCAKTSAERPNLYYPILNPNNGQEIMPSESRVWAYDKNTHQKNVEANLLYWGKDGQARMPRIKKFLAGSKDVVPRTIWSGEAVGHNQEAKLEIQSLLSENFATPKPTKLIRQILQIATKPGDLVLDSFAGSGTTGHAVLQLNKEDGGDRRFILVEMDENIAQNITSERLRRVIAGYNTTPGLGGGFRYCTLGEPLFAEDGAINPAVSYGELARHIFFSEMETPLPSEEHPEGPLLGTHGETAVYLLYHGDGTAILDNASLKKLPPHPGGEGLPRLIFAEACRLSNARRAAENIIFKQVPYEVKTR